MDSGMYRKVFDHLGRDLFIFGGLAVVGLATIIVALGVGGWWLFSHLVWH